jgi:formate hydrogenlyase subunit 4
MNWSLLLYIAANAVFAMLAAPLFMGVVKKVKAWCQGRKGPSVLQPYYNIMKLFRKETVVSSNSSWVTRATPYVNIAVLVVAALFVPLLFLPDNLAGMTVFGNVILFFYLLALANFFMALTGLDAGSTFGGMGSSREMSLAAILEPVILLTFLALAFVFKTFNLFEIFKTTSTTGILSVNPLLILLAVAFFIIIVAETARLPVDNPETHLELTMVHEAMVLEHSGKHLALMELAHAMKQLLLMAIFINLFLPFGFATQLTAGALAFAALLFLAKGILLAAVIGFFESSIAKLRLFRVPSFFTVSAFLVFLTIILEVFK